MFKVLIFAVCLAFAAAISGPCTNCNSAKVKLPTQIDSRAPSGSCKTVEVDPCPSFPCSLKRNTTVNFKVTFQAGAAASSLTAQVHGIINKIPIPFPLPNPDGCKGAGIQCPLVAGQTYVYTDSLFIQPSYPTISVVVQWALKDENGNSVFCVVVPAKITN